MSQIPPPIGLPPAPIPVQALQYSLPMQQSRPGIITSIGTLCIVIACLSGIASMIFGIYGLGFFMISKMAATRPAMRTAMVAAAPTTSAALSSDNANVATNTLKSMLSLDAAHVRELDKLLRAQGRAILRGDDDAPVTSASVQAVIQASGSSAVNGQRMAHFDTAQGHVEIFSDHSVFNSSDGSRTVTMSAANGSESVTESATAVYSSGFSSASTLLTPAQVAQAVAAVQGAAQQPLTGKQLASLRQALSASNQQLVTPGSTTPVVSVYVVPKGDAHITFDTGSSMVIGPGGQVISSGPPVMPNFGVTGTSVAMVLGDAAASIALDIYLLIVGILVFRSYMRSPRLLRIYALIKIPLALLAGTGLVLMVYQFFSGVSGSSAWGPATTPPPIAAYLIWAIMLAVCGCAFPVGLLIAMRTRSVLEYFNSIQTP